MIRTGLFYSLTWKLGALGVVLLFCRRRGLMLGIFHPPKIINNSKHMDFKV